MIRYQLALLGHSQRYLPPVLLFLSLLAVLYNDRRAPVVPEYAVSAGGLFVVACWLTIALVETEDPVQRLITLAHARGQRRLILGVVAAYVGLWVVFRPAGIPTSAYVGQLVGTVSVVLLSMALVLVSSLPAVEEWFDGIDRAAIWHRRMAITGLLLLPLHIPLSSSPIHSRYGGLLGAVGVWGMGALALWAIVPRWQSVVPSGSRLHPSYKMPIEHLISED